MPIITKMEKDIILLKLLDLTKMVEESTGEQNINEVELSPVPYAHDDIYITGFKVNTPSPMIRLKVIKKLKLAQQTPQEIEYYTYSPDADFWIDCEALDEYTLSMTLTQITKNILKTMPSYVIYFEYIENGKLIKHNVAYETKKLACKDILTLRKKIPSLSWKFSDSFRNTQHTMTDLEFATAAL